MNLGNEPDYCKHCHGKGPVPNVTLETVLESLFTVKVSSQVSFRVRIMEPGRICTVDGNSYFGKSALGAAMAALAATRQAQFNMPPTPPPS